MKLEDLAQYLEPGDQNPIQYGLEVMNDVNANKARRDWFAIALLSYFRETRNERGVKHKLQENAANVEAGNMFTPRLTPKVPEMYLSTARRREPIDNSILDQILVS